MIVRIDLPYFPRHGLVAEVFQILTSGLKQGITLFAPRRHGKTSFVVNELLPAARARGWQTLYVDLWERRSEPELGLVEALEALVESRDKGWRRRFRLSELRTKATLAFGAVESTHVPLRHVREDVLENRLSDALGKLASKGVTLLVLDEVQALAGVQREDFVASLRTVLQKCRGHLVVFYTGSSREGLNSMFRQQRAPLFASAMPVDLPEFGDEFIDDRLAFLLARSKSTVARGDLAAAFERLGRTPEFLNELVLQLIVAGDGDIERAMSAWVKHQRESGIGIILDGLTPLEAAVLRYLAENEHASPYSGQSLNQMRLMSGATQVMHRHQIQTAIKRLVRLQLIAPKGYRGRYGLEDRALLIQLRMIADDSHASGLDANAAPARPR